MKNGFTLIEVLVFILIFGIIFGGIVGGFVAGMKILFQSKARTTALALANQRIEEIRNLPYKDIGTIGGIPSGVIPQTETKRVNNIDFTIKTTIIYIDDPFDKTAPDDPVPTDYKRVKVRVSWPSIIGGQVQLITDIAPKGIETTQGGGTLSIVVLNASGEPVSQAEVRIKNDQVLPPIDATYLTDDFGTIFLPGAPASSESYQVEVKKSGYSSDKTFSRDEVANPSKPHLSVYEGQLTQASFSIDLLSSMNIESRAQESFDDEFNNFSKVSEYSNLEIEQGMVRLKQIGSYAPSGYLISQTIWPENLFNWSSLEFIDSKDPYTDITYQILYEKDQNWEPIPDEDLPGNEAGFRNFPVDLSLLDTLKYPKIRIRANFFTSQAESTPYLDEWHLYYNTPLIGDVSFHLRGSKIIGTDINDQPVYKYSKDLKTNSQGKLLLDQMEWDSYYFSANSQTEMDLLRVVPSNPTNLLPSQSQNVSLYFGVENTLLVAVQDKETKEPIFGARVELQNQDYDKVLPTEKNGKAYFLPLDVGNYNLFVSASGYQDSTTQVFVSGKKTITVNLERQQ